MIVGAQRAPLYIAGNPLAGLAIAIAIALHLLLLPLLSVTLMPLFCDAIHVASTFAFVFVLPTIYS